MRELLVLLLFSLNMYSWAADESADVILKRTDNIRNPPEAFIMEVEVNDGEGSAFRYEIKIGGKNKSVITTIAPKREVGKNFLMIDQEMWVYIPNIRRSLRVALGQKMAGQFANGDIGRMRWHGNYDARIVQTTPEEWTLELKANKTGLTYEGMRIYVDRHSYRPLRADYLTGAGRVLKHVRFKDYRALAGATRPSLLEIRNADDPSQVSTLRVLRMEKTDFSDAAFSRQALN